MRGLGGPNVPAKMLLFYASARVKLKMNRITENDLILSHFTDWYKMHIIFKRPYSGSLSSSRTLRQIRLQVIAFVLSPSHGLFREARRMNRMKAKKQHWRFSPEAQNCPLTPGLGSLTTRANCHLPSAPVSTSCHV